MFKYDLLSWVKQLIFCNNLKQMENPISGNWRITNCIYMFNLDYYYPLFNSMYNCALSQSSQVDCQTLICVNPWQTWIRFRLIELVSMHLIMLMRLEPREVW